MAITKFNLLIGMFMVAVIVGCDPEPEVNTGHAMTANEFYMQVVLSRGDHPAVVKYCTAAIKLHPDDYVFYSARASSFEALQYWDAALADYGEMIRIDPKDTTALAFRSRLYQRMGMPEQAAVDDRAYAAAMTERDPHWPAEEAVRKIWSDLDGYAPEDYEKLSTREKAIWNVFWFHAEVMNGGIDQYFVNSAGDHAADCLAALEIIGATILHAVQTEGLSKSMFSMSLLPLARGRRWPTGRMRGLTWSEYDEPENSGFSPPHPSPLPPWKTCKVGKSMAGGEGTIARKSTASFLTA